MCKKWMLDNCKAVYAREPKAACAGGKRVLHPYDSPPQWDQREASDTFQEASSVKSGRYSDITSSPYQCPPSNPHSTLQPTMLPTGMTLLTRSKKDSQSYPPRDLRMACWWCRLVSWGLRSPFSHDATTANHSARADGLAFQLAVSPPRACNDTLNTVRRVYHCCRCWQCADEI